MRIMPSGDYYLWDCDWCDSLNRTLWTRIDDGILVCGVCFASYHVSESGQNDECSSSGVFTNRMLLEESPVVDETDR
jgi:hypothetical protein